MQYSYQCEKCGHQCCIEKRMKDATRPEYCPKCDFTLVRDFVADNITGATAALANEIRGYPYVSSRLPRDLEGCRHDPIGKPIIESKSHEKEVMSRTGMRRE